MVYEKLHGGFSNDFLVALVLGVPFFLILLPRAVMTSKRYLTYEEEKQEEAQDEVWIAEHQDSILRYAMQNSNEDIMLVDSSSVDTLPVILDDEDDMRDEEIHAVTKSLQFPRAMTYSPVTPESRENAGEEWRSDSDSDGDDDESYYDAPSESQENNKHNTRRSRMLDDQQSSSSMPTAVFLDNISHSLAKDISKADHDEKISIADTQFHLAVILCNQAKYEQAIKVFQRCERAHKAIVEESMASVASAMRKQGRYLKKSGSKDLLAATYMKTAKMLLESSPSSLKKAWEVHKENRCRGIGVNREWRQMSKRVERRLRRVTDEAIALAHTLKMLAQCRRFSSSGDLEHNSTV